MSIRAPHICMPALARRRPSSSPTLRGNGLKRGPTAFISERTSPSATVAQANDLVRRANLERVALATRLNPALVDR